MISFYSLWIAVRIYSARLERFVEVYRALVLFRGWAQGDEQYRHETLP